MNKVILTGRLTRDPDIRTTSGGKKLAGFILAVQRDKEKADFIACQAWDKTADLIEAHVTKGQKIAVVGKITVSNYEKDGEKKTSTTVIVSEVEFLERKPEAKAEPAKEPGYYDGDDTYIPF